MVLDALEIVPVVGVCQSVAWRLPGVYTARAAPAPTPVVNVAVGKSKIGTAVVLFTRQTTPGVVLARGIVKHLSKVGFVAGGGVGVDERQHAGWRWVYQLAEFSPLPGIRVPRRDAPHIPRVENTIQLVGASSQQTAIANDRGFIRWATVNPHRAVVGEQQTTLRFAVVTSCLASPTAQDGARLSHPFNVGQVEIGGRAWLLSSTYRSQQS